MTFAAVEPVASTDDVYEIIDGRTTEWPEMSVESTGIVTLLAHLINVITRESVGVAYGEMLIKLALPKSRVRRPDVAFVPYTLWAKGKALPRTRAWTVTPAVCVEVVSPTDEAEELMTKVTEYLDAGVGQVWVVYPVTRVAVVYDAAAPVRLLRAADELTGGPALPEFAVKLSDLIPEPEAA